MNSYLSLEDQKEQIVMWVKNVVKEPLDGIISSIESIKRKKEIYEREKDTVLSMELCVKNILGQLENFEHCKNTSLRYRIVDIDTFCKEIILIVSQQANFKNQKLSYSISEDCPRQLLCEPIKLKQILINLLFNSIKYTQQGGEIRLLLEVEKEKKKLKISVIDNGMGIDREELPQIFKEYHQSKRIKKERLDKYGGVGLGLPISKELAKLINGELSAYSEGADKGSVFVLTIPLDTLDYS